LTNRLANGLLSAGLKRGDRVGIYLNKSVNQVLSIFAIAKAGGVVVPINHLLFPDQVRHLINDCRITGVITSGTGYESLQKILPETPSVEFVIATSNNVVDTSTPGFVGLEKILQSESASKPPDANISQDLAAILYTSGSTGRPKGIMLSHANLVAGARIVSSYVRMNQEDRILSILPFSFDYGLNQLLTTFLHGGTLILLSFHFPDQIVQALIKEKITGLAGVPPLWRLLTQPSSSFHRHAFSHLRYITNSGGVLPIAAVESLRKTLPKTKIYLMYGLTEAFRSTYLPPEELERRPTSIGKAIPDTEIFVLKDTGEPCKPQEVGELVHRGPTVAMGYWGLPEATYKVFRPNPFLPPETPQSERVCYSGDLVKMDEEGYLYYVGRRDATIKSSGYRISPTEVEEVLYATGRIRDAAVIGVPDGILGHSIKAFVVPQNGENIQTDELLAFCAAKMPRYMVPRQIEIRGDLPKTGSGKIDYQALRKHQSEQYQRD